jgi:hypothetical protein
VVSIADAIKALLAEIEAELFRFPAVDGDALAKRVAAAVRSGES